MIELTQETIDEVNADLKAHFDELVAKSGQPNVAMACLVDRDIMVFLANYQEAIEVTNLAGFTMPNLIEGVSVIVN